jgi:hypothetical protein
MGDFVVMVRHSANGESFNQVGEVVTIEDESAFVDSIEKGWLERSGDPETEPAEAPAPEPAAEPAEVDPNTGQPAEG